MLGGTPPPEFLGVEAARRPDCHRCVGSVPTACGRAHGCKHKRHAGEGRTLEALAPHVRTRVRAFLLMQPARDRTQLQAQVRNVVLQVQPGVEMEAFRRDTYKPATTRPGVCRRVATPCSSLARPIGVQPKLGDIFLPQGHKHVLCTFKFLRYLQNSHCAIGATGLK
jgi:hypothetical protein